MLQSCFTLGQTCLAVAFGLLLLPNCTEQLNLGRPESRPDSSSDSVPAPTVTDIEIPGCPLVQIDELKVGMDRPIALMVVERSQSMQESFGQTSRIDAVAGAALKTLTNRRLSVGLIQFPGTSVFCPAGQACCASKVLITPRSDNGLAIDKALRCEQQGLSCAQTINDTPTGAALSQARAYLRGLMVPHVRAAVFLITDGDPSCGGAFSQQCEAAVTEAAALSQDYVRTHVWGLGQEAQKSTCLPRISEAGELRNSDEPWTASTTAFQFEQRFTRAVAMMEEAFCRGRLLFSERREDLHLFVEGKEVPWAKEGHEAASSFELDVGSNRFRIYGEACEQLKRNDSEVQMFKACCPAQRECH